MGSVRIANDMDRILAIHPLQKITQRPRLLIPGHCNSNEDFHHEDPEHPIRIWFQFPGSGFQALASEVQSLADHNEGLADASEGAACRNKMSGPAWPGQKANTSEALGNLK